MYGLRPFKWKPLRSTFMRYCLLCCTKVVLSLWENPWCVTIQIKDIEQYFHVVLFIMPYKVFYLLRLIQVKLSRCKQGGYPTYFNAPVVAERGCRRARLVLSRLNSSPWVVSSLSLESLIVTSLVERILLRSLINDAADVGVARRMGVKSLNQKKKH